MNGLLLLVAVLLVGGCNGCATQPGQAPVPGPTSSPPPVMADGGGGCEASCSAAQGRCQKPEVTVADCTHFCTMGGEQLDRKTPRCRARILTCSETCAP